VYDFFNAALNTHYLYAWNETIGHEGVNNIISAEHHYHSNYKTGAKNGRKWMDNCYGQANNQVMMKYMLHITDPGSPAGMYLYERFDEFVATSGHSYLVCDGAFGQIQKHARGKKMIANKKQWMAIMREANTTNPNEVIDFEQKLHRDWKAYLKQFYIGKVSKGSDGELFRFIAAQWRNYGIGEVWIPAEHRYIMMAHPGEVWVRYTADPKEPPQRIEYRKNCNKKTVKYQSVNFSNVRTQDLVQLEGIETIGSARCELCDVPLGVTKDKKDDLVGLSAYLPLDDQDEDAELLVAVPPADTGAEADSDSEGE
jgi:hypothetical protein